MSSADRRSLPAVMYSGTARPEPRRHALGMTRCMTSHSHLDAVCDVTHPLERGLCPWPSLQVAYLSSGGDAARASSWYLAYFNRPRTLDPWRIAHSVLTSPPVTQTSPAGSGSRRITSAEVWSGFLPSSTDRRSCHVPAVTSLGDN